MAAKRRRRPRKVPLPPVALKSPVVKEDLPLRWVYYPEHYGTFIGFAKTANSKPVLCACTEGAVRNCLALALAGVRTQIYHRGDLRVLRLPSQDFPSRLVRVALGKDVDPMTWLRFESKLCHRCNVATPSLRFCHEMYGEKFKQGYGWYINQAAYRLGANPVWPQCIDDVTPEEIVTKITELKRLQDRKPETRTKVLDVSKDSPHFVEEVGGWPAEVFADPESEKELQRSAARLRRELQNYFENIAREEFGFRRVGEGWVSESLLFKIVCRVLPETETISSLPVRLSARW